MENKQIKKDNKKWLAKVNQWLSSDSMKFVMVMSDGPELICEEYRYVKKQLSNLECHLLASKLKYNNSTNQLSI